MILARSSRSSFMRFISLFLAVFIIITMNVSADVSLLSYRMPTSSGYFEFQRIVIHGEIRQGDYDKFVDILRQLDSLPDEVPELARIPSVLLSSPGGDVVEAMRIGHVIRTLSSGVEVPSTVLFREWDLERGVFEEPRFEITLEGLARKQSLELENTCFSACFFLYIAGVQRTISNTFIHPDDWTRARHMDPGMIKELNQENASKMSPIGIHRPFFEKKYFGLLDSESARKEYQAMEEDTRKYLKEMGLGDKWIARMFSVSSNEILRLSYGDLWEIGLDDPSWEEWKIAACGYSSIKEAIRKNPDFTGDVKEAIECLGDRLISERMRLWRGFLR